MAVPPVAYRVEVVAAVISRPSGEILLARRPPGKVYEGYWEFPGGKVEGAEHPYRALRRELREELGLEVDVAWPWITREYHYAHANVRLNFFRVPEWHPEPTSREGQALSWQRIEKITVAPLLPANEPILRALALPPILAITDAHSRGTSQLLERLDASLRNGLKMVMVREKEMAIAQLRDLILAVRKMCRRYDCLVVVNADADLATRTHSDGVHLTSTQLMHCSHRPALPLVGASCHSPAELDRAAQLGCDYAVLGPILPTPSHQNMPHLGWQRFARLVRRYTVPVYGLGGMTRADLNHAHLHGAHGLAMIRGAWEE
ncbi:MAG: Nudix family hydrolase [Betaproteobacteria bacterium]